MRHRDSGKLFVPVKGLVVDDQGELCFEDVTGERHYGAALQDHIDRTLRTFGLLEQPAR